MRRDLLPVLKWIAIGLVLLFLFLRLVLFWLSTLGYGDVALGDDRSAVLYSLGTPQEARGAAGAIDATPPNAQDGAGRWFYPTASGGRIMVGFDGGGRAGTIACGQPDGQPGACPAMVGNDIGMLEGDLYRTFGSPDRERIVDGTKLAIYDDVGVTYRLKRFRIVQMEMRAQQGGVFGKLYRYVRSLVP